MTQNLLPCSFYGITRTLAPGGSVTLYELIGQVENKQLLKEYFAEKKDAAYFEAKKKLMNLGRGADRRYPQPGQPPRRSMPTAGTPIWTMCCAAVIRCSRGTIRSFYVSFQKTR